MAALAPMFMQAPRLAHRGTGARTVRGAEEDEMATSARA